MKPSSTDLTGEQKTFHFALATGRYKDNRIPPKGFRIAEAAARLSVPVWHGVEDPSYYTAAEYAGGYDDVSLTIAAGADSVEVNLYYQTTSREYIEFLRDEINGNPDNLTLPASAYIIQTDPFFDQLKAWGSTIWDLWTHNRNVDGAAPFLMAQASVGGGGPCAAPVPTLLTAAPGHSQVTLTWSDEHSADPAVVGYGVYYDQADKAQWIADVGQVTSYLDSGLTNGQQYCYEVSSRYADCESGFSNILCATPDNQTQAGADSLVTGYYTGRGNNRTWVDSDLFTSGDAVVFRVHVVDAGGIPVAGAVVDIDVSGPEAHSFTTAHSDANGWAEATWNTQKPNKRGQGGTTPGLYTAAVAGLTADGYIWDGVATSATFTIQQ